MNYVYQIKINNTVRYIGISNDLDRREAQHRSGVKSNTPKPFYQWCNTNGIKASDITLEPIFKHSKRVEVKRYEAFWILHYYFSDNNTLLNKLPAISGR